MLKSTILSTVAFTFLVVVWAITPARADCPHKDRFDHKHCDNVPTECPDGHVLLGDGSCVDVNGLVDQLVQLLPGFDACAVGVMAKSGPIVDNCDGTISDTSTGLMWEKKVAGASGSCVDDDKLHSVDATCDWFDATGGWIDKLNERCNDDPTMDCSVDADCSGVGGQCGFAGYTDWRLPEVNQDGGTAELETILLSPFPCGPTPCIDPIFDPTAASVYWSATTSASSDAWSVDFRDGDIDFDPKSSGDNTVRAVRTGP